MCIPNYPDKNIPTLLIYRNGEITGNVVAGLGLNGMKTTVQGEFESQMVLGMPDFQIWSDCFCGVRPSRSRQMRSSKDAKRKKTTGSKRMWEW
jgi:hypothetical protein